MFFYRITTPEKSVLEKSQNHSKSFKMMSNYFNRSIIVPSPCLKVLTVPKVHDLAPKT